MSKAVTVIEEVRSSLMRMEGQFKAALPSHISAEKFIRVAQTAITTNPDLLNANRTSLYAACVKAAQDGLLPDGKEAALVIFKDTVAYLPMVSGILKKVRNSGELATITSQIIHKGDEFKYWIDTEGEHLEHTPNLFDNRGDPIGTYALAKTKDGAVYIEVMTKDQVMAVKDSSRSKNSGPWAGNFHLEMWRKTVIRRLSKRLPMSTDLEMTLHADDEVFEMEPKEEPTPIRDAAPTQSVNNGVDTSQRLSEVVGESEVPL